MNIIPKLQKVTLKDKKVNIKNIKWEFAEGVDQRVVDAARRVSSAKEGFCGKIFHENDVEEGYTLSINDEGIIIRGKNAAGAFYGIMSLEMILKENNGVCSYCEIVDKPDMQHRSFYHDVSRGKVPTLESLKKLADEAARYKLNSLQIYFEHTYAFKEYAYVNDKLGYLTKEEVIEFDNYCRERFIELVPSLACFGHLYHLLEMEEYKHLCELKDYVPDKLYWIDRMMHHTINPELEESFCIIKSLIDQFCEVFKSNKFNICGDETFDLGRDVNLGKDKATLYINFVNKLIAYLELKGKTVMMWGDIVLKHPEKINELSDNIIFLNWAYGKEVGEKRFTAFKDYNKQQIVCPGTSSWNAFSCDAFVCEKNIALLAKYGYENGALGMLNTNWGDFGNICSVEMASYGLVCGAAVSWNKETIFDDAFRKQASVMLYGNIEMVSLLYRLSLIRDVANWHKSIWYESAQEFPNPKDVPDNFESLVTEYEDISDFENAMKVCEEVKEKIEELQFSSDDLKEEAIIAVCGYAFVICWRAANGGIKINNSIDFEKWVDSFQKKWLLKNKKSELVEVVRIFEELNKRYRTLIPALKE